MYRAEVDWKYWLKFAYTYAPAFPFHCQLSGDYVSVLSETSLSKRNCLENCCEILTHTKITEL